MSSIVGLSITCQFYDSQVPKPALISVSKALKRERERSGEEERINVAVACSSPDVICVYVIFQDLLSFCP